MALRKDLRERREWCVQTPWGRQEAAGGTLRSQEEGAGVERRGVGEEFREARVWGD